MKNLFGWEKKPLKNYNDKYVIRDLDQLQSVKLDEISQRNLSARKTAALPFWLLIVAMLAATVGLGLVAVGIPESFESFTNTNLIFLIVGGVLCVFGWVILIISRVRTKKLDQNPYFKQSVAEEEKLTDEILKVPENAQSVYMLIADSDKANPVYQLQPMKVFKEGELLCFSDGVEVTGIPASQIMTAYILNAKTRFYPMVEISKEKAKECGITNSVNGGYRKIGSRLVAEVQLDGEMYEITVAGYDAEKFSQFLNKQIIIM
ncbi:MAG: hypothetical protein NC311_12125 [Muribaculaceae bacterium]|nr:hypothetical protein [Muribaculaceae bacterium]